jgi:hypothetical protein
VSPSCHESLTAYKQQLYKFFSAIRYAAIIGDIRGKGKTGDRSSAVGPDRPDSLELGRGVLIGQQIGTDGRPGPRLDWMLDERKKGTRPSLMFVERKSRWNAYCLRSAVVTRTMCSILSL